MTANINKLYWIISITFLLCSCNSRQQYENFINDNIDKYIGSEVSDKYDSIIVMPRVGCGSCINESERFLHNHINDNRTLFIFTRVGNLKRLKIEIGETYLCRDNVLIDTLNLFHKPSYSDSAYPLLLERMPNNKFSYSLLRGHR